MIRWLVLLCCLLTGAVAAELSFPPAGDPAAVDMIAAYRPTIQSAITPPRDSRDLADQWLTIILGRPLFTADRKPVGGMVDPTIPRLTGIITAPGGAVALFQPQGHAKPLAKRHGDSVSGWKVTEVATNAVNLQRANDRIVLRPRFDNSLTGAAERAAAEPPPTRWEAAAPSGLLRARWSNPQLQP